MKLRKKLILIILVVVALITQSAYLSVFADDDFLFLGGEPAGFTIKTYGATVIGLSDVVSEGGVFSPAKNADVRIGDVITSIDGKDVGSIEFIAETLNETKGNPVKIDLERDGQKISKYVSPRKDSTGNYKLGLFLRDDLSGIGTITYFEKDGSFAALGHPVLSEKGEMLKVSSGNCYLCSIIGVNKGERGKAGELKGIFIEDKRLGVITDNRCTGLYGKADKNYGYSKHTKVQVGTGVIGNASIIACVDGVTPKEYSVSVVKTDFNDKENKNFVIKITDKALLDQTNGILQGMSGSPIIQKGKIIGAVTHVFINDPTRGFGISISKMLEK